MAAKTVTLFLMDGSPSVAGSKLREEITHSAPDSATVNRSKYADRISSDHELLKDTLFSSPSAASDFLTGASTSGKIYWKNELGITLRELERKELAQTNE